MAIDPQHLLEQARQLTNISTGAPRQTDLRRAISNAYYALFHTFATTMADSFVGQKYNREDRYELIYRALNHGPAKNNCKKYIADNPPSALRDIANDFIELQDARHKADYAPNEQFSQTETRAYIDQSTRSIKSWKRVSMEKRADFLVRLLFTKR